MILTTCVILVETKMQKQRAPVQHNQHHQSIPRQKLPFERTYLVFVCDFTKFVAAAAKIRSFSGGLESTFF